MLPPSRPTNDTPEHFASWKPRIAETIESLAGEILAHQRGAGASQPLMDELRHFLRRPGKRVRPLLLLHSYTTFAGHEPTPAVFRLAAALELLHAFILAHDDVIDGSDERSGQPTLHRAVEGRLSLVHGRDRVARSLAIVLGDILFSGAQEAVLASDFDDRVKIRLLSALCAYMTETGIGELEDVLFGVADIGRITAADVEHMYWLKTTRYSIECPLVLGAIAAGRDGALLDSLREMSRPLGFAFQIRNDLKAFRAFEISDAIVPDDFLEGKKTLLMAAAYEALGETDRHLLQICLSQRPASESALTILKELVIKSAAVGHCETRLREILDQGARLLHSIPAIEAERRGLCQALAFLGMIVEDCADSSPTPSVTETDTPSHASA